jgi:hypothetical protein
MPFYRVTVNIVTTLGIVEVEAESPEQARDLALEMDDDYNIQHIDDKIVDPAEDIEEITRDEYEEEFEYEYEIDE